MQKTRVFVIGDIHGCYRTLESLLEQMQPNKKDILVFLGDYIDRGPRSKETIDRLLQLKNEGLNLHLLMGNHEWMLLEAYNHGSHNWFYNGALNTLQSFEIDDVLSLDKIYLKFFQQLSYYYQYEKFLFVHAGFADSSDLWSKDTYQMLWTRNEIYKSHYFVNKTIIHGHTPMSFTTLENRIANHEQVLNIDTGCVYKLRNGLNRLTALELTNMHIFSVKNCD